MIGSGTARRDRPRLNVRGVFPSPPTSPLRVVLNTHGDLPHEGPLFDQTLGKTLVFSSTPHPDPLCEVIVTPEGIDLTAVLTTLGQRGVLQVMVEGGATLLGSLLKASLINRLVIYVGPRILGDLGKPLFQGVDIPDIYSAPKLKLIDVKQLDDCVRMTYENHSAPSL